MLLLILDSLGSTELLFILVVALIFFGPRKLPQISRKLGKSIADFKRASEDFKRTWEREVALEAEREGSGRNLFSDEDGFREHSYDDDQQLSEPAVDAIPADRTISRESSDSPSQDTKVPTAEIGGEWPAPEASRKQDWL